MYAKCMLRVNRLVAKSSKLSIVGSQEGSLVLGSSLLQLDQSSLAGMVDSTISLSLFLQSGNHSLVLPAKLLGQSADSAVRSAGPQPQDTHGRGNNQTALTIHRSRAALKDSQSGQGSSTTVGLVGQHATDGTPEDAAGSTVVDVAAVPGVADGLLGQVGLELELAAEEVTGDVDFLGADHGDATTSQQLLGYDAGKTTHQVIFAVNDDAG